MKDDRLYLVHIVESIEKIESYTAGMDVAKMRSLGWQAGIDLHEGLRKIYRWYVK